MRRDWITKFYPILQSSFRCRLRALHQSVQKLIEAIGAADLNDYNQLLLVTMMTIGLFGLMRSGELCWPNEPEAQSWTKIVFRSGVTQGEDWVGLRLKFMKNDRFYQGSDVFVKARNDGADPVAIFRRYLAARDARHHAHPALFLLESGNVPTRSWFIPSLKLALGDDLSGHSFRAGGATLMAMEGFSEDQIRKAGRWKSEAFRLYIRNNELLSYALRSQCA